MNNKDLYYLLGLQKVKNVGDISARKLLRHFGSAQAIFEAAKRNQIDVPEIGTLMTQSIKGFNDWTKVDVEMRYIEQNHIRVVTVFDEDYPHKLFHAPDAPILFFWQGKGKFTAPRSISIVGTRNITRYGKRMVAEIIDGLKEYNPLIVSGLAYGIDIEAHLNALKNDLSTIGVLGHGFQRIYPSVHKKIADTMLENGGLITEFWQSDIVDRNNFLRRNRIIAGLTEATLIVESAEKGGSLVTADIANSYNRDVFAVPGRANDTFSKGCNNLIKRNQAALITGAEDIIKYLQWENQHNKPVNPQLNLFVDLSDEEQKIYEFFLADVSPIKLPSSLKLKLTWRSVESGYDIVEYSIMDEAGIPGPRLLELLQRLKLLPEFAREQSDFVCLPNASQPLDASDLG